MEPHTDMLQTLTDTELDALVASTLDEADVGLEEPQPRFRAYNVPRTTANGGHQRGRADSRKHPAIPLFVRRSPQSRASRRTPPGSFPS